MLYPVPLREGDKVALISPATTVKREYVEEAAECLRSVGLEPVIAPHALGPACGTYAASADERLDDFLAAWTDGSIKGVLCARGGFGCVHLLSRIPAGVLDRGCKWLIGFSDVSALHAMLLSHGIASLHAPMAKHLALLGTDDICSGALMDILFGEPGFEYEIPGTGLDTMGSVEGMLRGGNLAVLDGLSGTPYDILHVGEDEDVVLFIEDIAEPIYKVDRMLTRLYLEGSLGRAKGLLVGQFTEYAPDANFSTVEAMIRTRLEEWGLRNLPVAFDFPVGHIDSNLPLIEGARVRLEITDSGGSLTTV